MAPEPGTSISAPLLITAALRTALALASRVYYLGSAIYLSLDPVTSTSAPMSDSPLLNDWAVLRQQLEDVTPQLQVSLSSRDIGCLAAEEERLEGLRESCVVLVGDLGVRVGRVSGLKKADRDGFRRLWSSTDLTVLGKKLEGFRREVEGVAIPFLKRTIDLASLSQTPPYPKLKDVLEIVAGNHDILSEDTQQGLLANGNKEIPISHDAADLLDAVQLTDKTGPAQLNEAPWNPHVHVSSDKANLLQDFILESLSFSSMKDREDEVAEAHRKTFEWIFETNSPQTVGSNFLRWLKDDDQRIYWINGKAGSGKSTLMRYIHENEKTTDQLRMWAGEMPLTTAGFFFWTSGSLEQRSQAGLLRYLLFQLLEQHRSSIPAVFPELWEECWNARTQDRIKTTMSWSLLSLKKGLKNFLHYAAGKMKICLLIDGLDEFDGDHDEIIDLFKSVIDSTRKEVKVCVSSRPWAVFERAFKSIPSLKLQDLTLNDMTQYVSDKLNNDPRVRRIVRKEPEDAVKFMGDIIQKADGVFLWAILAVRSLLIDLQSGDKVSNLQERLSILPSDLDSLFQHTLFDIQPEANLQSASRIFQLLRAREVICSFTRDESAASLTLWELALASGADEFADQDLALHKPVQQATSEDVPRRCQDTTTRLVAHCAGLLEIHNRHGDKSSNNRARFLDPGSADDLTIAIHALTSSKITYLHRTVRDFLLQSHIWSIIQHHTSIPFFDAHLAQLRASVLILKLPLQEPERHRRLDEWWPLIVVALTHARYVSPGINSTPDANALVTALNETLSWYWVQRSSGRSMRRPPSFASSFSDSLYSSSSPSHSTASPSSPSASLQQGVTPPAQNPDHWATSAFATYESRAKLPPNTSPFLALCTKFGLDAYLAHTLSQNTYHYIPGSVPLLTHALHNLVNRRSTIYPLSSIAMIRTLLSNPDTGSPNVLYPISLPAAGTGKGAKMTTPWLNAAECVREAGRRGWIEHYDVEVEGTKRWVEILKVLVREGAADVTAIVEKNAWDERASVLDIVEGVWREFGGVSVGEVRELLLAKGAKGAKGEQE